MQVKVENLYYLLSYAWGSFEPRDLVEIAAEDGRSAEDTFARVLITEARRLLRQRLDRGYVEERDQLRRPRGRIHVAASVARGLDARGVLECSFDESTEDVIHNRMLKATALRLAGVEALKQDLRHGLLAVTREMPMVTDVRISAHDFQRVQLHSNLRRYRLAINVCALLYRCLLPDERTGGWRFRSFAGDEREMGLLFEAFVREFLSREQRVFAKVDRSRIQWAVDGETHGLVPTMNTDITLRNPDHVVIIETKCYGRPLVTRPHTGGTTLRPENLNQIVAYLTNFETNASRVDGVLLYAVDTPTIPATRLRVRNHDLWIRELNLNRPWREIAQDLQDLVRELGAAGATRRAQAVGAG